GRTALTFALPVVAVDRLTQGFKAYDATGAKFSRNLMEAWLAEAHVETGAMSRALQTAKSAVAMNDNFLVFAPLVLRIAGDLLSRHSATLGKTQLQLSNARLRQNIAKRLPMRKRMGARLFELQAAVGLVRLLRDRGDTAAAHALLSPVYAKFAE